MDNLKIGIVVADIDEFHPLYNKVKSGDFEETCVLKRRLLKYEISDGGFTAQILAAHCGIGKVNAAAMTAKLIDMGCNVILNYGLSGGISRITRGELTLPDRFLEHDFDMSALGYDNYQKPQQDAYIYKADTSLLAIAKDVIGDVKIGTAVTGDKFICDNDLRYKLASNFNAVSCDMETAAIAYVCEYSDIPFLAIRRVSDDAGNDAIDTYREMNSSNETLLCDYVEKVIKSILHLYLV